MLLADRRMGGYETATRDVGGRGGGIRARRLARHPATWRRLSAIVSDRVTSANPVVSAPAAKSSMLLEALKEELFQLEVERKQGKITPAEYEKAKAALDQTLDRALKRQG